MEEDGTPGLLVVLKGDVGADELDGVGAEWELRRGAVVAVG